MLTKHTVLFQRYWQASTETQAQQARNAIVEDFMPRIKRLAWRYVSLDQQDRCADMEQDLYVAALEIIPTVPHEHPAPGGYLYRILKLRWQTLVHTLLNERDRHLASIEAPLTDHKFTLADIVAAPTQVARNEQASSRLQAALAWLPPLQKISVQDRYQFENVAFQAPPEGLSSRWQRDALTDAYRSLRKLLSSPIPIGPRVCSICGAPIPDARTTRRVLCGRQECRQANLRQWRQARKVQVQA